MHPSSLGWSQPSAQGRGGNGSTAAAHGGRGRARWHLRLQRWQHAAGFSVEFKIVPGAACNLRLAVSYSAPPSPAPRHGCVVVRKAPWGAGALHPNWCPACQPSGCHAVPCLAVSKRALLWRIVRLGSRQSWGREESILKRTCQVQLALSV